MEWEDAPKGNFLTKVKQRVLWKNEKTGATAVLYKYPLGLADPGHRHPDANQWVYAICGECELPAGTRVPMEGIFGYSPKNEIHGAGFNVTQEAIILHIWDGPPTRINEDR